MRLSSCLGADILGPVIQRAMTSQTCLSILRLLVSPCHSWRKVHLLDAGTAIEARCILYDKIVTWIGNTNVMYSIDGVYLGTASHNPTNATDYLYNQSLFRVSNLANTEHILRVNLLNPSMLLVRALHSVCDCQRLMPESVRLFGL